MKFTVIPERRETNEMSPHKHLPGSTFWTLETKIIVQGYWTFLPQEFVCQGTREKEAAQRRN